MKTNKNNVKERILTEEDYIYCPRLSNSLKKLLEVHPNGVEDEKICKMLLIDQYELNKMYDNIIKKFRTHIGIKED